jgi:hypothetical protein
MSGYGAFSASLNVALSGHIPQILRYAGFCGGEGAPAGNKTPPQVLPPGLLDNE